MQVDVVTFAGKSNAYSLKVGLRKLGITLRTLEPSPSMPIPVTTQQPDESTFLVMTEERSVRRALQGEVRGRFLPCKFPLDLLDEKFSFAQWLSVDDDLPNAPAQEPLSHQPSWGYPCLVKSRSSWVDGKSTPRGYVCTNDAELSKTLAKIEASSRSPDGFFLQQWLPDADEISVCGFYDSASPERNITAVTRRTVDVKPGRPTSSAAVTTVDDRWGLIEAASAVLDKLDYTGPYEIEFLVTDSSVLLLELNPRFWLQHGIFIGHGNGLLRRYLGIDTAVDHATRLLPRTSWFDGNSIIERLLHGDVSLLLRALRSAVSPRERTVILPDLPTAVTSGLRRRLAGRVARARRTRARRRART